MSISFAFALCKTLADAFATSAAFSVSRLGFWFQGFLTRVGETVDHNHKNTEHFDLEVRVQRNLVCQGST